MNKITAFFMAVLIVLCCICTAAYADGSISFSLDAPTTVKPGEEFNLVIKIDRLPCAITAFELTLSFDRDMAIPKITDNASLQMDAFMTVNKQGWEQLCRYDEANGRYHLRFCAVQDKYGNENQITDTADMVLTLPFTAGQEGVFAFQTSEIMAFDHDLNLISGINSACSITVSRTDAMYMTSLSFDAYEGGYSMLGAVIANIGRVDINEITFDISTGNAIPAFNTATVAIYDGWTLKYTFSEDEKVCRVVISASGKKLTPGQDIVLEIPFIVTGLEGETAVFSTCNFGGRGASEHGVLGIGTLLSTVIAKTNGFSFTGSAVYERDGYIYGIKPGDTAAQLQAVCSSAITAESDTLFTGCRVTLSDGRYADIVIKGDVDGDGRVDATDYILVKRACIGAYSLQDPQAKAADIDDDGLNALDYYKIKMHVLERYSIF